MKKTLLLCMALVATLAVKAQIRSWDFTKWSDATVANLKADAAASKIEGWSDVEKKADAEADAEPTDLSKDNCFWYTGTVNEDGSLSANGTVIEELKGLKFDATYAGKRSLAIAVNYPETSLGTYTGGAYLWLGGKNSACFVIPNVKAGSMITIVAESHKPAEGRGVGLYQGDTQIGENFTPTTQDSKVWNVPSDGDVTVKNTNGCHIYYLMVVEPILTLKGTVGEEVSIKPGVYGEFDIFSVDFGDGVLVTDSVGHQNKGVCVNDGTEAWPQKEGTTHTGITEFKGTVAGDGIIKVYGNDKLWFLTVSGALPTSFDQENMKNLVQFTISKVAADAIDLKGLDDLKIFSISQASLKSINVKENAALTNLTINNNTASAFESVLENLDLSGNANLELLNVMAASAAKPGLLKTLDLSNNTKLTSLYAQYNALTSVILPEGAALTFLNLQNNQLESIDLSKVASFKDTYLNNNNLTTVDLSKLTAGANLYLDGNQLAEVTVPVSVKNLQLNNNKLTKVSIVDATASCKLENNLLTFATLPAQPASLNTTSKAKKFTYAPQAALEVAESLSELDLSAQLTVEKGVLADDYTTYLTATTTFSFVTAGGTALVEGTDYEVTAPGKFKFLKSQTEKVHGVMLNAAFPKFTEAAPFVTTEFTVDTTTGINGISSNSNAAKLYNLQGVEVKQAGKGLYIQNGKIVVVK